MMTLFLFWLPHTSEYEIRDVAPVFSAVKHLRRQLATSEVPRLPVSSNHINIRPLSDDYVMRPASFKNMSR